MKKFLKILTIIISITLVIQLGTMSLNINQVQADVGNFKSYKSKSSSSSKSYKSYKSSSPKTKIFKPHKSNSSSKKYYSPSKSYSTPSSNNYNYNNNTVNNQNTNTQTQQAPTTDDTDYLYPILMYLAPFLLTKNMNNGYGRGGNLRFGGFIGIIVIIIIIIAIIKGKGK